MKKYRFKHFTSWSLTALIAVCIALPVWAQEVEMTVGRAIQHDTSGSMDNVVPIDPANMGLNKQVPLGDSGRTGRFPDLAEPDGGLQSAASPGKQLAPTPAPIVSAFGLSNDDNAATIGGRIVPPDVNGDIGLDQNGNRIYIQYINLIWGVFDDTGALINGPFAGNSFWQGFGGACETNNDGDPVVLYDDQAGQWFFSQFSINQGIQCVAISVDSNPLGPYHRYAFVVSPGEQNDYPKLGVWDDGTTGSTGQSAYTFTVRDFPFNPAAFMGMGVMERDKMLVGDPTAVFVKFRFPCVNDDCMEGQLPPHLAGPTPPAGTCPTFWMAIDSAFDDSPYANDGYRNHTLCADWSNPGASTMTEGPYVPAGSNFDRFVGNISPGNGGESLDALQFFTMYRAQYRWFGSHGSVTLNTTVDAGGDLAGIRWAEVRSADGDAPWTLQQDGTYAPADGLERWMGSIAQDQDGNIALGYSVAGNGIFPSVRYSSRMAGDAQGTMPGGEVSCHEGTGVQTGSSNRWGDYSSMSVDPTDDCTFWYTQEYYETTGSFDFNTRICSFKFAGCGGTTACSSDADCDNGLYCDGAETCNTGTGQCEDGSPPTCEDDGLFCNGAEACNETTDSCAGTPPACVDVCDEVADICIGCGDGVCDPGEDCNSCPGDCVSGDLPGAVCGNGTCEAVDGENGVNCSADCNARLNGKPSSRFSCGFNDGYSPNGCGDSRCTSGGWACTEIPVESGQYCCGDGFCESPEDGAICGLDCGDPGFCGDDEAVPPEVCDGSDLGGLTCTDFGFVSGTLGCYNDCSGYDTSGCVAGTCDLGEVGDTCEANADCCSNKCKGKPGAKTCR